MFELCRRQRFVGLPDVTGISSYLILALIVMFSAATSEAEDAPPNVVIFMSDDQGWGDLSLHGNKDLRTPNIDSLAEEGARFNQFMVCAVCAPTRAEFLTGRYHPRSGVSGVSRGEERMNTDEETIADMLKAAGYATGAFGKWHNGTQWPYHPNARGFDEYYGFCSGHWGHYFSPMMDHNGDIVKGEGYIIDDLTTRAIEWIGKHKDRPFFAYFPYNTPHSPMQVPDKYWDRHKSKTLQMNHKQADDHTRAALAMCENIDWNVGRVLKHLDALGLKENTIVMYFSDNGPNGNRWNGDMRGKKGSTDDGGVRSPLVMRWPAGIEPGHVVKPLTAAMDILPTISELTGAKRKGDKPLDGRSFAALLKSTVEDWPERTIVNQWRRGASVRTDRFRLDAKGRLYDMQEDVGQTQDVADRHSEAVVEMKAVLADYMNSVGAAESGSEDSFVLTYPGSKLTQMPIRDAVSSGEIQRSSKHPNSSYFFNWVDTNDSITWKAVAKQSGTYEVELFYAVPPEDVGAELELRFNGEVLPYTITKGRNTTFLGEGHYRSKRGEGHEKNFTRVSMGKMKIKKGSGELELAALSKPGAMVAEVRLLLFRKVDE